MRSGLTQIPRTLSVGVVRSKKLHAGLPLESWIGGAPNVSQSLVFVSGSSQLNNVARVKPQAKNCYRTNFLKTARSVESKPTLDEAAELLRDLEMAAANVNRAARRFPRAAFTGVSGSVVSISQAGPARDDRIG